MSHRSIAFTLALIGALCGLTCSAATASPLLSGYGGPGAGEQVILGSQLLNTLGGPGAGAQSAAISTLESSSPPGSTGASGGIPTAQTSQPEDGASPQPATRHADRPSRAARSELSTPTSQLAGEVAASTQVSYDLRSGLSDRGLVLIGLAVAALLVLAIATRTVSRLQR